MRGQIEGACGSETSHDIRTIIRQIDELDQDTSVLMKKKLTNHSRMQADSDERERSSGEFRPLYGIKELPSQESQSTR